jgi:hypothetical protein
VKLPQGLGAPPSQGQIVELSESPGVLFPEPIQRGIFLQFGHKFKNLADRQTESKNARQKRLV